MKILLSLMIIPFLVTQECCNNKSKQSVATSTDTTQVQQPDTLLSEIVTPLPDTVKPDSQRPDGHNLSPFPACIKKLIDETEGKSSAERPLQVDEYIYNGRTVYLFTAPCCDQFNMLYDDKCNVLCAASGGFTGRGDGKCPDFLKEAKHIKTIWKNSSSK
jgi:hypothetical protein